MEILCHTAALNRKNQIEHSSIIPESSTHKRVTRCEPLHFNLVAPERTEEIQTKASDSRDKKHDKTDFLDLTLKTIYDHGTI